MGDRRIYKPQDVKSTGSHLSKDKLASLDKNYQDSRAGDLQSRILSNVGS
jgi:hypothetical protein